MFNFVTDYVSFCISAASVKFILGLIFHLTSKYAISYKQQPQNTADSGKIR